MNFCSNLKNIGTFGTFGTFKHNYLIYNKLKNTNLFQNLFQYYFFWNKSKFCSKMKKTCSKLEQVLEHYKSNDSMGCSKCSKCSKFFYISFRIKK